jgi:hypothetical protein
VEFAGASAPSPSTTSTMVSTLVLARALVQELGAVVQS